MEPLQEPMPTVDQSIVINAGRRATCPENVPKVVAISALIAKGRATLAGTVLSQEVEAVADVEVEVVVGEEDVGVAEADPASMPRLRTRRCPSETMNKCFA